MAHAIPASIPGDPETVRRFAETYRNTAEALRDAANELLTLANENVTIGKAVDEVRDKASEVQAATLKVATRYDGAADAYFVYRQDLTDAQAKAETARNQISGDNSTDTYWRNRKRTLMLEVLVTPTPEKVDDLKEATDRVAQLDADHAGAQTMYDQAVQDAYDAATRAMSALDDAASAAGLNDGFWEAVVGGLQELYELAQKYLAPVIERLRTMLEVLKSIVDILALIVSVLSVFLPFLAPLAAALTLVGLALSAAILLCSLALVVLGRESVGRLLSDAIGLATSVITSKLGGAKLFSGEKLRGFSSVFTRSAWSKGANMMRFEFALSSAVMGKTETMASYGLDVAARLFDPQKTAIRLTSGITGGIVKGGLSDMTLDFFPETGSSAGFVSVDGGWDLDTDELTLAIAKPVVNTLSGGAMNPVIALTGGLEKLMVGAS